MTVTDTLTPTLQATLTHPTGQILRAEAEIEHDPAATGQGSGQIWTGAADNVASGTQASIAVPANTLTDGWKVRWRLRAVAGDTSSAWSDWQQTTVDVIQPGEEPLAQTTGPVIRTDRSFTAAAWLRWSNKDGDYIAAEQRGTHQAPFRLGNTADHGLIFTMTSADTADATTQGVLSGVEPPVGEWFHLAGVYDATARTVTLYLNGTPLKAETISFAAWNADRPMWLGSAMQGAIDDVRVYQHPLTAAEITALSGGSTVPAAESAKDADGTPSASPTLTEKSPDVQPRSGANADPFDVDYEHFTLDTCRAKGPKRFKFGAWTSAQVYSGCSVRWHAIAVFVYNPNIGTWKRQEKPDGGTVLDLSWRSTFVINTYLGTRDGHSVRNPGDDGVTGHKPQDISMWVAFDQIRWDDSHPTAWHTPLKLHVTARGDGATCRKKVNGDLEAPAHQWRGRIQYYRFTSDVGPRQLTRCSIFPWAQFLDSDQNYGDQHVPLWDPGLKRSHVARPSS
ncbi:LamG domain-containing protein [Nonomuraea africana]|uniref:LamG domain-containing protein n=1 Tax=Nonomuraea africana TaxID=46171 RepID=UPI003405FE89